MMMLGTFWMVGAFYDISTSVMHRISWAHLRLEEANGSIGSGPFRKFSKEQVVQPL